jgi:uncharacterized glyoxalase superfamily protein PhnB
MHPSAHLHVNGEGREAFRCYADVLGGRSVFVMACRAPPLGAAAGPGRSSAA